MKCHLKKGYDKKKPKRWVLVYKGIDGSFYPPPYSIFAARDIMKMFWKNDFHPSKITLPGAEFCNLYFYFRSHAEEARFLLTYSDNIEKGFDL